MGMMAFAAGVVRAAVLELPVAEPPHLVDGELADPCWKKAYETPAFGLINGKEASETTKAYLFRDDKFLYVGVVCGFRPEYYAQEEKNTIEAKGPFDRDNIEIFLDPGMTGSYAHIGVGVNGSIGVSGKAEGADFRYGVQLHKTDWSVEVRIPFDAVKLPKTGKLEKNWRINVTRGHTDIKEDSSWAKLVSGTFHEAGRFFEVKGIPADLENIRRKQAYAARGDFELESDRIIYTDQAEAVLTVELKYTKPMKGFRLVADVTDLASNSVAHVEKSPVFFTNELKIPTAKLARGRNVVKVRFVDDKGVDVRSGEQNVWKTTPATYEPHFEIRDQVMYRDGRFFFPIFTPASGTDLKAEKGHELDFMEGSLRDLADHGFTAVCFGPETLVEGDNKTMEKANALCAWHTAPHRKLQQAGVTFPDMAKVAERNGLAVISDMRWLYGLWPVNIDGFVNAVTLYRDIPNLLAWDVADELDYSVEQNRLRGRLCREIDPNRPSWLNVINAVGQNKDATDIISTDPYPIPKSRVSMVCAHGDRLIDCTKGEPKKSQWIWLQNFGGEGGWTRPPTPVEIRAMIYCAMNHGVKGIGYWVYFPPEKRDGKRQDPASWEECGKCNWELRKGRAEICVLGQKLFCGSVGDFDVAAFEYKGKRHLSVVNTNPKKEQTQKIAVKGWPEQELTLPPNGQKWIEL